MVPPVQTYYAYVGPVFIAANNPAPVPVPAPVPLPAPAPVPAPVPVPAPAPVPAPKPLTPIESGNEKAPLKDGSCFYLQNAKNNQYITFGDNGLEVKWSSQNPGGNEKVCVENGPNDAYFIHWKKEWNKVFDIFNGETKDGVRLIKYPKHGGVNQQFRFKRNASGQYQFIAVNSGKAFGIWGAGIAQSTPSDDLAQFWNLIPA